MPGCKELHGCRRHHVYHMNDADDRLRCSDDVALWAGVAATRRTAWRTASHHAGVGVALDAAPGDQRAVCARHTRNRRIGVGAHAGVVAYPRPLLAARHEARLAACGAGRTPLDRMLAILIETASLAQRVRGMRNTANILTVVGERPAVTARCRGGPCVCRAHATGKQDIRAWDRCGNSDARDQQQCAEDEALANVFHLAVLPSVGSSALGCCG